MLQTRYVLDSISGGRRSPREFRQTGSRGHNMTTRYAFSIDLDVCIGLCQACVVACKTGNEVVLRIHLSPSATSFAGQFPDLFGKFRSSSLLPLRRCAFGVEVARLGNALEWNG